MQHPLPLDEMMIRSATFSQCGQYRYSLQRIWFPDQKPVMFIGLNPSTADAEMDDPTIRRCMRFAQDWGFGGLVMTNLFAYRSTDPRNLSLAEDPIGPDNNQWIETMSLSCDLVVAAWGNHGSYLNRSSAMRSLFPDLHCIQLNRSGEPAHPLYLKGTLRPKRWADCQDSG